MAENTFFKELKQSKKSASEDLKIKEKNQNKQIQKMIINNKAKIAKILLKSCENGNQKSLELFFKTFIIPAQEKERLKSQAQEMSDENIDIVKDALKELVDSEDRTDKIDSGKAK